jgi:pseudaminic acid synthase
MMIGNVLVSRESAPVVVAEVSGNHNGSLSRALEIIDAIAASGAQAVKLQTYTADTMTLDLAEGEFFIADPASPWKGESLYSLYEKAFTPWEWHEALFRRARERGLVPFSTPFDASAVDFLESLGTPAYKVASFENRDLALIRRVAATGKPVIISTGMATLTEIQEAVSAARAAGCRELALLKCTSSYPADAAYSNLLTIPQLRAEFECEVGLSDHTMGVGAAVASVALGATLIEKHVTLRRSDGGVDSGFSLEPAELRMLVDEVRTARQALGAITFGPTPQELASLVFRRSLYICEDLEPGDVLTPQNLRAIRPGLGLPPKFLDDLLGKRVTRSVRRGTPASWDLIG